MESKAKQYIAWEKRSELEKKKEKSLCDQGSQSAQMRDIQVSWNVRLEAGDFARIRWLEWAHVFCLRREK